LPTWRRPGGIPSSCSVDCAEVLLPMQVGAYHLVAGGTILGDLC